MTQVRFSIHFNEEIEIQIFNWVGLELWSMSDNTSFDNLLITDNMVLAAAFTRGTFELKQAAESAVPLPMHFQVSSSLIEEIYICQADHGHSHKDLLIMWSATCPQHQILLLGFFGKTRLFTKHVCRQLMS